ncbi:hypothetical protein VTK26DRAFT_2280 [Humicola hyalothermophila]
MNSRRLVSQTHIDRSATETQQFSRRDQGLPGYLCSFCQCPVETPMTPTIAFPESGLWVTADFCLLCTSDASASPIPNTRTTTTSSRAVGRLTRFCRAPALPARPCLRPDCPPPASASLPIFRATGTEQTPRAEGNFGFAPTRLRNATTDARAVVSFSSPRLHYEPLSKLVSIAKMHFSSPAQRCALVSQVGPACRCIAVSSPHACLNSDSCSSTANIAQCRSWLST